MKAYWTVANFPGVLSKQYFMFAITRERYKFKHCNRQCFQNRSDKEINHLSKKIAKTCTFNFSLKKKLFFDDLIIFNS